VKPLLFAQNPVSRRRGPVLFAKKPASWRRGALPRLSPEERAALENRLAGRSDADLADETGENRRTIAARYDRAVKWLKDRFKKEAS